MWIIVDANEARTGLPDLLSMSWDLVRVRRLSIGDVAIGDQVLVERKTTADLVSSLADGRLFRQARQLASRVSRPVVIQEGNPADLRGQIDPGAYRGALLSLSIGFRIPVLLTRDLEHTGIVLRHIAAQESKRQSRRKRSLAVRGDSRSEGCCTQRSALPSNAMAVLRSLPGVGRTRADAIAAHVSSLSQLASLGVRDLLKIPGIGPDTAARIVDTLRGHKPHEC